MNIPWHDADLAFAWGDNTRAIRTDETTGTFRQHCLYSHHVDDRDSFRDTNNQLNAGIGRLQDRIGRERRRDEDHGCVASGLFSRLGDCVEDWNLTVEPLPPFSWRDSCHDLRAVV